MNNSKIEKIFQISAVILIGVAAYFLWRGSNDGLFVAGVLGAACFFLSVRFQVKERMEQREFDDAEAEEMEEDIIEKNGNLELNPNNDALSDREIIESGNKPIDSRPQTSDHHL